MKNDRLHHYNGTGKVKYVNTTKLSQPKTYTNNLWIAVSEMHAELIYQGVPYSEVVKFILEEVNGNLKLCNSYAKQVMDEKK